MKDIDHDSRTEGLRTVNPMLVPHQDTNLGGLSFYFTSTSQRSVDLTCKYESTRFTQHRMFDESDLAVL